ncbi:hypothetical protein C7M61_004406 [Candidozyma pseudohaemuli]|uniref:Mediator of RNA polymerase II transcription subunit 20 n=1 Tax=Candidozyma pseudohaemuli TaxID=418784 RepID=A0A2P7YI47_9ASCO|nr:hypothetical protein C7M61_004406 [[Candida] pseudohaemulonii]PSK35617.1 hypothetical protein C7M61_004406 [[Candida] pseudohaemulonii]
MVSAVLLVHKATPGTITQFHDILSNRLPTLKGKWSFTFKIFRNNIHSIPPELAETHDSAPESQFLYTWSPSYLNDSCVTLINKKNATVMSHIVQEELGSSGNAELAIPNDHLHKGATSGLNDSFDFLVGHRMQSMWTQRQTIRGDGGQIYELENGNVTIRTANVSLHGNFRGFLIQIEDDHTKSDTTDRKAIIDELIKKYDIPSGNLCFDVMDPAQLDIYGDLALQYAEILNF